ncbi:MAG: zinc ribbon domain-containing protein [Lautropia sp.]
MAGPDAAAPTVESRRECPECGAELVWSPPHQSLACAYCGTVVPTAVAAGAIAVPAGSIAVAAGSTAVEQDLLAALRDPPDGRGWGSGRREIQCNSCKAISVFVDGRVAQNCDFCGSPSVLVHESRNDAITPQSVLPFRIEERAVRDKVRAWYGKRWFAPNRLKSAAFTDRLHGVYLPYWTFDARVSARWTAEAGYSYYQTQQVRGADGSVRTQQVRQVRWEPAAGSFEHFFDDELVPGTEGAHARLLRRIEPFPTTTDLRPYQPEFVRGWTVERYQLDLRRAQAANLADMQAQVRALAARQVPGDTQRNLQVDAEYTGRTFKHVLVPVWLISYRYQGRPYQILTNGYTGAIAGEQPYSWAKIALAVLVAALVLLVLASLEAR